MTDKPAAGSRRSIVSFAGDDEIRLQRRSNSRTPDRQGGAWLPVREVSALRSVTDLTTDPRGQLLATPFMCDLDPKTASASREFAWRHRLKKGDAMTLLLDYAEAEERRRSSENE